MQLIRPQQFSFKENANVRLITRRSLVRVQFPLQSKSNQKWLLFFYAVKSRVYMISSLFVKT